MKDRLSEWGLYDKCNINKTDMSIELPNGSKFIFKGLDDPEKIKSISGICDIWCEEATELNEEDFDQSCLRLRNRRKKNNQIFISFNPVSKTNWVYKRWFDEGKLGEKLNNISDEVGNYFEDEMISILKTTYKDNKFLPQDYIDNLLSMKESNYAYYKIYCLGLFSSLGKKVYKNWKECRFNIHDLLDKYGDNLKFCYGLDFGFVADPTAIVCCAVNEATKELWIYDGFDKRGLTNEEIYKQLVNMQIHKTKIYCDCAEQKSIEELRRLGARRCTPCKKGKDSIIHGIQFLQNYTIYVNSNLTNIIEEFLNYEWKKDKQTGEYINEPVDKFNHYMDALRYSVQGLGRRSGKAKFYRI